MLEDEGESLGVDEGLLLGFDDGWEDGDSLGEKEGCELFRMHKTQLRKG